MKKLLATLILILFLAVSTTAIAAPISPFHPPATEHIMMLILGGGLIGLGTYFRKATNK